MDELVRASRGKWGDAASVGLVRGTCWLLHGRGQGAGGTERRYLRPYDCVEQAGGTPRMSRTPGCVPAGSPAPTPRMPPPPHHRAGRFPHVRRQEDDECGPHAAPGDQVGAHRQEQGCVGGGGEAGRRGGECRGGGGKAACWRCVGGCGQRREAGELLAGNALVKRW